MFYGVYFHYSVLPGDLLLEYALFPKSLFSFFVAMYR